MLFRFDFIVNPPSSPSPFLFLLVCFSLSLSAALLIFHFIFAYCLQFAFAFCCWLFPFLIFCVRISLFTQNSFGCICLQLRGVYGGEKRQLHECVCVAVRYLCMDNKSFTEIEKLFQYILFLQLIPTYVHSHINIYSILFHFNASQFFFCFHAMQMCWQGGVAVAFMISQCTQ